jgi:hypothetical protein
MVLARPRYSREIFRRTASPRLSSQDAGTRRSAGSRAHRAAEFAGAIIWRMDTVGPRAPGLGRDRRWISKLQPGFWPRDRRGDRSRGRQRQHGLHRRSAGRSVAIHQRGHQYCVNNVRGRPVTDDQATLSIGSIVIQPGNANPAQSVILVGTGEADNSADSYFGLGILRSADGGNTGTLIPTANGGTYSFSGLGATRMAFSTAGRPAL